MHELFAKDDGCLGRTLLFAACCFFTGCVEASPVYTVKQGDTLWGIAKAHKMSYKRLCELNNKPNGWSRIMIGEKIVVKDRFNFTTMQHDFKMARKDSALGRFCAESVTFAMRFPL